MLDLPQGVAFVREVKSCLTDAQYREFIDVLRAYRADNLTSVDVKTKCSALFEKRDDLLRGLLAFLPSGVGGGLADQEREAAVYAATPRSRELLSPASCSVPSATDGLDSPPTTAGRGSKRCSPGAAQEVAAHSRRRKR